MEHALQTLLRSGTAVTIDELCRSTGRTCAVVRAWLADLRDHRRLVTVTDHETVLVPRFQLNASGDDVDPVAAEAVHQLLEYGMDGWSIWDWALTPNTWLGGDTPADRLTSGDADAVRLAVNGLLQN